jgi:hypothetical protein
MGVGGIKKNDRAGEFNYDILLRILVNFTMYPQYNYIIFEKEKRKKFVSYSSED